MADTVACWLRGGWDLSFLDPDSVRFEERSIDDRGERTNCTVWSNSGQCRKQNSLALIVRRRRIHSYCEISPLPFHSTQLPLTLENTESQSEDNNSIDDNRTRHEYTNSPTTKTDRSSPPPPPPPPYQNLAAGCLPSEPEPPLLPPRVPVSPPSSAGRSTRSCPSIQLSPATEKKTKTRTPPPTPSESPSVADGRLLRPAAAALCRVSASPAADDSSAFSYREVEASGDFPRPELRHWRAARCFSTWDEDQLTRTFRRLSASGFYLGRVSFDEAKRLLRGCPVGTFLLRDSSDERFPFSLSVQTQRGTTSIRIIYDSPTGLFRLDSEPEQIHLMPTFDCVIRLIKFYVNVNSGALNNFVLLQMNGQRDMPVLLRRPYECTPPSLSHLCRKRINASLGNNNVNRLQLIPSLKAFLIDYPYDI